MSRMTINKLQAHVNHGDKLEVTALRTELKAGTEILNYYGPLPLSELLRRYGYVTPEHRRYDVVELPWSLVRAALAEQLKLTEDVLGEAVSDFVFLSDGILLILSKASYIG